MRHHCVSSQLAPKHPFIRNGGRSDTEPHQKQDQFSTSFKNISSQKMLIKPCLLNSMKGLMGSIVEMHVWKSFFFLFRSHFPVVLINYPQFILTLDLIFFFYQMFPSSKICKCMHMKEIFSKWRFTQWLWKQAVYILTYL